MPVVAKKLAGGRLALVLVLATLFLGACATTGAKNQLPEDAHVELALNFIAQKDYPNALDHLQQSEAIESNSADLLHAYAIFYQETNDLKRAQTYFRRAVAKEPANPQYNNNFGVLLSLTENYDQALKRFAIAYSNNQYINRAAALENSGDVKVKQENYDEAIEFYRKAYEINPDWFVLDAKIALAQYSLGDFGDSYQTFQTYMENVQRLSVLPSDQDIELGLAIAAAVGDYEKVQEYQEVLQQRAGDNL